MLKGLNRSGAPYGIHFNKMSRVSNSRLALEASEFARDAGKYDELHTLFFEAYFHDGKDIGDLQTVLDIAAGAGLDVEEIRGALARKTFSSRLLSARDMGAGYHVAGLPTFIINGKTKIVGAQPYATFVKAIIY
jgi:predicted DsbA family dithiol-disulfide isomerase